jgi:site-specific recombinase XerD
VLGLLGLVRKSKRPRSVRQSKIPQVFIDKILLIRKDNPTYGKAKIAVILLRDFTIRLSESSVGRVLKKLMLSGKIKRSFSAWRTRKKRNFAITMLNVGSMAKTHQGILVRWYK